MRDMGMGRHLLRFVCCILDAPLLIVVRSIATIVHAIASLKPTFMGVGALPLGLLLAVLAAHMARIGWDDVPHDFAKPTISFTDTPKR